MRILYSTPLLPPPRSGMALATRNEALLLQELGHDVQLVTGVSNAHVLSAMNGSSLATIGFDISGNGSLWRPIRGDTKRLGAFFRDGTWDLVIVQGWQNWATDSILAAVMDSGSDVPVFLRSHGLSTNSQFGPLAIRFARYLGWRHYRWRTVPQLLARVQCLVALAELEDDDRFLDVRMARAQGSYVHVIPNISPSFRNEVPAHRLQTNRAAGAEWLLCVGSFSRAKNELGVLKAYLAAGIGNVPLIFVGPKSNAYSASLDQLVRQAGFRNVRIVVNPSPSELADLYQGALAVVSASLTECQPLAILDGLAFGVPFLATDAGDLRDHKGGQVVDDIKSLGSAMKELTGRGELLATLRTRAEADYGERFAIDKVRTRWIELLATVGRAREN